MRYRQDYVGAPSGDFVYVIQGRDAVKIGVTRNLEERLATLQTGSPHPLTLAYSMPISGDAYRVEAEAHATLDRHRVSGEWFAVAPSLAVAAINEAAYRLGERREDSEEPKTAWYLWLRRILLLAALFTPVWTAIASRHMIAFFVLSFVCLVVLASALIRVRERERVGFAGALKWTGALAVSGVLSIITGALIGTAFADDRPPFPAYDPTEYCKRLSAFMGDNALIRDNCVSTQDDAKRQLLKVWASAPPKMETDCIHLMEAGGQTNYQAIGGCLAMSVGGAWLKGDLIIAPPR